MVAVPSPKSVAKSGAAIIQWVLIVALLGFVLWVGITHWLNRNKIERLQDRATTAEASATQQAAAATNNAEAAKNTGQAFGTLVVHIPEIRGATQQRVENIRENASRPVDPADLDPLGADSVRELEQAYKAASAAGTSRR